MQTEQIGRRFWTTKNEIDFIKEIGTGQFSKSVRVVSKSQIELLRGYVAGAKKRVVWDGIDRDACIGFALEKIRQLESVKVKTKGVN